MKYILYSYVKRPAQPASFWWNKIKLVLFIVLFCKQKALETLEKCTAPNPHPMMH